MGGISSASRRVIMSIRISEIFGPTIQGEGALIGEPTIFVRTGGCDYRCIWCDSLHAVDSTFRHQWQAMSHEVIFDEIQRLSGSSPLMVSLSGGNPAIQPLGELITLGHDHGYRFALETQGSVARNWFSDLDVLVLSPKPPSSGENVDWKVFDTCLEAANGKPKTVLKIVVFDDQDYDWAKEVAGRYDTLPFYLQPGNHTPPRGDADDAPIDLDGVMTRYDWLIEKTLNDRWFSPRILPQLHVLLWGNRRGV